MYGSVTNVRNPSKCTQWGNDSGSATAGASTANDYTTQVGSTSPLKAALLLKVYFIELLLNASRPYLTPLDKSTLCEFSCLFYGEEKAKEKKSDLSYVLSSVKKLKIVLQAMPEVQKSQCFKTLL